MAVVGEVGEVMWIGVGGGREVVNGGIGDVDGLSIGVIRGGKLHPCSGTKPRFVLRYHPSCPLSLVH